MAALNRLIILFALFSPSILAHDNGMNMDMDQGMDLTMGNMIQYLHFTSGDNLWFLGWVPKSAGAMVGTCIGLFMLALVERWLSAMRAVMEVHWNIRAQIVLSNKLNLPECHTPDTKTSNRALTRTKVPPFIATHDIPRGIIQAVISAIGFLFMLAVMTFQVGFILSIVVGLGVGETLFGRYTFHAAHLH
ncbi:CTR copper uptake transporter [Artomyces pyxidatus]|uniref:CTR copper uptake transporter n=1 Tax=Artomyces pyxidatus TaxID=48021 RepID=A0ACB8SY12_9AGAM|nr:CTR copper uptake transporter [Artomyces pyxidatus]